MDDVCSSEERRPGNPDAEASQNVEMYILDGASENSWNNFTGIQMMTPGGDQKNTTEPLKMEE